MCIRDSRREQERALKERAARLEEENEAVRQRISDLEAARRERTARIETIGTEIAERTARRNECESGTAALRADEKEIDARRETAARDVYKRQRGIYALRRDAPQYVYRVAVAAR